MKSFDQNHLTILLCTLVFFALSMLAVRKLPRKGQNVLFVLAAFLCSCGIFFRYGMGMKWSFDRIQWDVLASQMLQVCNFNMILVLLMLVPKFELARQYAFMFSMFAACTTLVSVSRDFADNNWYDVTVLNSWMNHVFAIALPLWMVATRRLKPQKKYILPVSGCVALYFLVSYVCTERLHKTGWLPLTKTFSFVHDPGGVGLLEWLYELIPVPFFYLVPLALPMVAFFWFLTWLFRNYRVQPFSKK